MKIVADENIPYVKEAFGNFGEVTVLPGRQIAAKSVQDADVLLVRSVTKVDENLLANSQVKFVATATIGTNHIDEKYLKSRGIGFASAKGSNANSVAEYVIAALFCLAKKKGFSLKEKALGVVGVGNIGSRVVRMAKGLGMKVLQNDPPLARKTRETRFLPLEELLQRANIITLHVPLTYAGEDATYHLFNADRIARMKPDGFLINTSRGAVVSSQPFKIALGANLLAGAVCDVWENEPLIDLELLNNVTLGTPHIAGYSLDGKVAGTTMISQAVSNFFHSPDPWEPQEILPSPSVPYLRVEALGKSEEEIIGEVISKIYDIEKDARKLHQLPEVPETERDLFFDKLRKEYPVRREFFNTKLEFTNATDGLRQKFFALGFQV